MSKSAQYKSHPIKKSQPLKQSKQSVKSNRHSITTTKTFKYRVSWERDEEVIECRGCLSPFSLTLRRHHCRSCGKIYCGSCASEQARVSGSKNIKRVCKWCKLDLVPTGFNQLDFGGDDTTSSTNKTEQNEVAEGQQSSRSNMKTMETQRSFDGRSSPCLSDLKKAWQTNPLDVDPKSDTTKTNINNNNHTTSSNNKDNDNSNNSNKKQAHNRSESMTNETLIKILSIPGNDRCVDCKSKNGLEWASLSHGTVCCLQCSGVHRSYGSHISFVRSLKLDRWEQKQIQQMILSGGNNHFWTFMTSNNEDNDNNNNNKTDINNKKHGKKNNSKTSFGTWDNPSAEKYASKKCQWYRNNLKNIVNGKEPLLPYVKEMEDISKDGTTNLGLTENNYSSNDTKTGSNKGHKSSSQPSSIISHHSSSQEMNATTSSTGDVKKDRRPHWFPDAEVKTCMHCELPFSMLRRRHHCRKCGHCICVNCAPNDNTRPIPEFGYTKDVRLCLKCFCPPSRRKKNGLGLGGGSN